MNCSMNLCEMDDFGPCEETPSYNEITRRALLANLETRAVITYWVDIGPSNSFHLVQAPVSEP